MEAPPASAAGGPSPAALEMVAKCIVPVKAEYLVKRQAPAAAKETAAADGTGAAPGAEEQAAAQPPAEAAARQEAAASASGPASARPAAAAGSESSKSKSRKQMRKALGGKAAELCNNHAVGRCTYGDGCRFSHDLEAYVRCGGPRDAGGAWK
jgi:tRNA-dihydrouridine synthase 3